MNMSSISRQLFPTILRSITRPTPRLYINPVRLSSPLATRIAKMSSTAAATTTTTTATTPLTEQTHYILSFYVPVESTSKVCSQVCQQSGAGSYPGGLYTEAYWTTRGTGQFRAMSGSNPAIGSAGSDQVEKVEEDKVEVLCLGVECARKAIEALKKAHPYEEVPYYIVRSETL